MENQVWLIFLIIPIQGDTMSTTDLRKRFLERVADKTSGYERNTREDYKLRKMSEKLHEEFDRIWLDILGQDSIFTLNDWDKALNNWLNSEMIGN
jgi:hypothetical protein